MIRICVLFALLLLQGSAMAAIEDESPCAWTDADREDGQLDCAARKTPRVEWTVAAADSHHYEGKASMLTAPVIFRAGAYRVDYSSRGKGYFVIILKFASGREETVVDRVGFGPGFYEFGLDTDQELVFSIKSYGSWEIQIQHQP